MPARAGSAIRSLAPDGTPAHSQFRNVTRLRRCEIGSGEMVLLDALAPGGRLTSFSNSLEISRV
jgi:hypothetical protein